ncbi:MAG: hypothetical protein KC708_20975, partial [Anaerolineae bacterium]|nr:hypothetical protein [Anaerolineae bacterium]
MGFVDAPAGAYVDKTPPKTRTDAIFKYLNIFLLWFFAIVMILPFLWLVSSSLKTQNAIFQYPPDFIPNPMVPENYINALTYKPFGQYFLNTIFVAGM